MARKDAPIKPKEKLFDSSDGACISADPSLFFPEGYDHRVQARLAKEYCAECPIVMVCLEYAIRNEMMGIWGGTTMRERAIIGNNDKLKADYVRSLVLSRGKNDLAPLVDESDAFADKD
jgi:hypothetical protein